MSSTVFRRFSEELVTIIGRRIEVETIEGKKHTGNLLAIDERLDIILDNIFQGNGKAFKTIISGRVIKEVKVLEAPFDLKALAERIGKVFPGLVKIREDLGAIIVMDKIKVTENGVVEGSGLAADRVKSVYNEFIKK